MTKLEAYHLAVEYLNQINYHPESNSIDSYEVDVVLKVADQIITWAYSPVKLLDGTELIFTKNAIPSC